MSQVVLRLVQDSFLNQHYQKALNCLNELKAHCVKVRFYSYCFFYDSFNEAFFSSKSKQVRISSITNDFIIPFLFALEGRFILFRFIVVERYA